MHLDRHFARRTQVGAPGRARDSQSRLGGGCGAAGLSDQGRKHTRQIPAAALSRRTGAPSEFETGPTSQIEFEVVAADIAVALVKLSSQPGKSVAERAAQPASAPPTMSEPADLRFEQLAGQTGTVAIADGDAAIAVSRAAATLSALSGIKALLATSQIVGMACPGLHSLFAGLDINFDRVGQSGRPFAYAVRKVDARFRSLQIDISGYGAMGRLDAFARPPPPSQAGMAEICRPRHRNPLCGPEIACRRRLPRARRGDGENRRRRRRTFRHHLQGKQHTRPNASSAEILKCGGQCDILHYDALSPARRAAERTRHRRLRLLFRDAKDIPAQISLVRAGEAAHLLEFLCRRLFRPLQRAGSRSTCKTRRVLSVDGRDRSGDRQHHANMRWRRSPVKPLRPASISSCPTFTSYAAACPGS